MSFRIILTVVRNHILQTQPLQDTECRIRLGPEPPAWCGDQFLSVWPAHLQQGPEAHQDAIDEVYGVNLTLTNRIPHLPDDYLPDEAFFRKADGMEIILRNITISLLKYRYDILSSINDLLDGTYQYTEPLLWMETEALPRLVGPDWFQTEPEATTLGLTVTSRFSGLRRCQPYSYME